MCMSGVTQVSHPTLVLCQLRGVAPHKFNFGSLQAICALIKVPAWLNLSHSQYVRLNQLEYMVLWFVSCIHCAPLCPASPQQLGNVNESFDFGHRTGAVASLLPVAIHFCYIAPHPYHLLLHEVHELHGLYWLYHLLLSHQLFGQRYDHWAGRHGSKQLQPGQLLGKVLRLELLEEILSRIWWVQDTCSNWKVSISQVLIQATIYVLHVHHEVTTLLRLTIALMQIRYLLLQDPPCNPKTRVHQCSKP